MANYRAIASGLWSAGATWAGGAVPANGEGHNIYSNNFTVTIDTNVNVATLTNAAITASFVGGGTSAAAGGGFTVSASGLSVIANITGVVNATNALAFTAPNPATLIVTGNITANAAIGGAISGHAIFNASTGAITINTAVITTGAFNSQSKAVYNSTTGQIILNTCTINGGLRSAEAAVVNINGGVVIANNCVMTALSVNNTGTIVATNCVFNATTVAEAVLSTGTTRLSGTFVTATNGRQPINAAVWTLNTTPTASYIQQALDGVNANSFVRYYTADNALGQANPTDVRSGVSYASGNLTGRLTVPARGSVSLNVNYGPSMPFTATCSGTTATATLAYSYPLVVGDQITVTGASNTEWNSIYTIASVVSGTSVTFTVPASHSATAGVGATMQTTGTAVLDPAAVASAVWGAATRSLTTSSGPTAVEIRQEMDSNSTKLANLDATVSSRLAPSGTLAVVTTLTNAPTVPTASAIASQVRTELATELARVDAAITTRAPSGTLATDVTAIKAKTDALVTDRLAQCSTVATTGAQLAAALS